MTDESKRMVQSMNTIVNYTGDVDELTNGTLAYFTGNASNVPVATAGFIFTFGSANGYRLQIYASGVGDIVFYLRINIYGEWRQWKQISLL